MGIRGLETFLDMIYSGDPAQRHRVYTERRVAQLRFVVDGNNFSYTMASLFNANGTGGVYDSYASFLAPIASSFHLVVFDGSKEGQIKAKRRLENKCGQLSNVGGMRAQNESHEAFLSQYPALLDRIVLYEVLEELGIQYKMAEGIADHVIALYASGHILNDGRKFTVLSKDSSFNIYNLEEGYVSNKHLLDMLRSSEGHQIDMATATLPVFHIRSLLDYLSLDAHLTWIYFCLLLGTNDDPDLGRNTTAIE